MLYVAVPPIVSRMCPALQLAGAVSGSVVRGLAGLDNWLESNKLLPELKPLEVPKAVQDEAGELNAECREVRQRPAAAHINTHMSHVWW